MTIKQKQCLLMYLGYYTGSIDGLWGEKSRAATESFQRDYLLSVDGAFGDATAQKIREVVASGELPADRPQAGADWWKEIRYFTRKEFRCPCPRCGGFPVEPDETLVRLAERVRAHFGVPITISSGVRCQAHNDELRGSVPNSRHVLGKAMDFCVRDFSSAAVLDYLQSLVKQGVLRYAYAINESYVHMDVA